MTTVKQVIGRLPVNLGDYDSTRAYGKKNRVNLYGCEWESLVENNQDAPATWDGSETIAPNENWRLVTGNPAAWAMVQDKPYDPVLYPDNGMGRIVLKKNLPFAEQLTQTNTIYVIKYDFDLEDPDGESPVQVPEGCVIEFEGGSLRNGSLSLENGCHFNGGCHTDLTLLTSDGNEIHGCSIVNTNNKQCVKGNRLGNILIEGCIFDNHSEGYIVGDYVYGGVNCVSFGILSGDIDSVVIKNNIFKHKRMGVEFWGRRSSDVICTVKSIEITDNVFIGYVDEDIYLSRTARWPISIDYDKDICERFVVDNNKMNGGFYGIEVVRGVTAAYLNNNYIENCIRVIQFGGSVSNNVITKNFFIGEVYICRLTPCPNTVIIDNMFNNCTIVATNTENIDIERNKFTISNDSDSSLSVNSSPIYITGTNSNIIIKGCEIFNYKDGNYIGTCNGENITFIDNKINKPIVINNVAYSDENYVVDATDGVTRYITKKSNESNIETALNLLGLGGFVFNSTNNCLTFKTKLGTASSRLNSIGQVLSSGINNLKGVESAGIYSFMQDANQNKGILLVFCNYGSKCTTQVLITAQSLTLANDILSPGNTGAYPFIYYRKCTYTDGAWGDWSSWQYITCVNTRTYGATRPTALNSESVGYAFFDTALGKPIYWNGAAWVDATGATV